MKTNRLLRKLANYYPKSLKSPHDYVGLMTGKLKEDTKVIALCLDLDEVSLEKILEQRRNIDLILTHHPFIYGTRARTLKYNEVKRAMVEKVDALNIPVYSMHTNFDTGTPGMNDALVEALGLTNIITPEKEKMMRCGDLPYEMDIEEFSHYVNEKLGLKYSLLVNGGTKRVKNMAIIGGGGSRRFLIAKDAGYDVFVSGDAPHNVRRDILANHYNYLDVSHEVERIFMPQMKKMLLSIDPSLEIVVVDHEEQPLLIK